MAPNERSSLLSGNNSQTPFGGEQEKSDPSFLQSYKALLFGGWVNVLLIAVPFSFASHFAGWNASITFMVSFLAIVPLASLLGDATEQCSLKVGQTLGGLLNATFGNAVEAIVGIIALKQNQLRIVQTSMLGSILSNILLVLGCSFFAAGFKFNEAQFQVTGAQLSASVMTLAVCTLIIPAAYHANQKASVAGGFFQYLAASEEGKAIIEEKAGIDGLLFISRGTAIILLCIYATYLFFQLKTHAYLFEAAKNDDDEEEDPAKMNVWAAVSALVVVTVITSFCADYLVDSIDEFANDYGIPKAFIGLILIPIVGNAAEHLTSVWMAAKGKMEIVIGVSVGSSIQIAVGVIPLLVLVGWAMGRELTLYFENFETICLFIAVTLVNSLLQDGKSNYIEGLMLVSLYVVIGLAFWVS